MIKAQGNTKPNISGENISDRILSEGETVHSLYISDQTWNLLPPLVVKANVNFVRIQSAVLELFTVVCE